jgi:hypothetical protein
MMVISGRKVLWQPDFVIPDRRRLVTFLVEMRKMKGWFEELDLENIDHQGIAGVLDKRHYEVIDGENMRTV